MLDLRAPCPQCGKLASDLRTTDPPDAKAGMSQIAMQAVPAMGAMPDIPDLVVPVSKPSTVTKPSARADFDDELAGGDLQIDLSAAESPPKAGIARPPTPGVGFSPFDDDMSGGPSLELDTEGGVPPPRASSPSVSSQPSLPVPPAPVSHRSLQQPVHAEPAKPAIDPYEARVLADYGPKPEAFWHAPVYAYRVMARRSALQRDLATKKSDAQRALKRYEDALVALGERARSGGGPAGALERVKQAEDLLRSRDGALAQTMDVHKGALSEIDARLGAAEAELSRARQEEARVQAIREAAEQDFQRADAKVKRLEIEIRNGANKAAERDALAQDAQQKGALRVETDKKLAEAKRVSAVAQAKADAVGSERAQQESKFSRASGTRNAGVDDAQVHLRAALVELGRAVLADPASGAALAHAKEEIARLDQQAQRSTNDLALHESAITAYDAPQVFLGMVLVGV
ncbi:MAG TPA: hypothetical protein VH054_24090, partial [Polyangiaceae bacterium]|nr:hypothetical protein [Polyangiaceae bacterium]